MADRGNQEYWRDTLTAGGCTRLPRWSSGPAGEAARSFPLALRSPEAQEPTPALLLAVHAKVLAAVAGETTVATGYRPPRAAEALPCRITLHDGSWQELIAEARRAEEELLRHADFPVAALRRELGPAAQSFETVLDLGGGDPDEGDLGEIALRAEVDVPGGRLRLRYRTDVLDEEYARRIAGYYQAALDLAVAAPAARHAERSLLSAQELRHQLDVLAGPPRDLPDRRFHELFEERVREHPAEVAAACGEQELTYAELNARANRIAWGLLGRGLAAEDVVAVAAERDLDWMAAVIAILKAGGTYLPVDPRFPADRVATMLERSSCRFVLAAGPVEGAGRVITFADVVAGVTREDDPGVAVTAGQAAYIYFTSGSTGLPKGAVCEHAGMLNHLLAKIEDLRIGPGDVVAQTAPQCFDISLWQLLAAPMAGARTLIVEQDVILDVRRFVRTLTDRRVNVAQLVPSYLEAVLAHLDDEPRPLPALRFVSVTGEAVKKELLVRWFARFPGVGVLNAYGLTETHDDTNHEMLERAPDGEGVPLGAPIPGARVYVLDEDQRPAPLGSPGEIAFSGQCVARGYIGDAERTRLAFSEDPHRPGLRLYRSGDYGYWRADGKLAFLGRRDAQVKIRGHRVELGEVENRLLRVPGVRGGAVLVAEAGGGRRLVAFYTAGGPIPEEEMRAALGRALPVYMLPERFHWMESLPLTGNGKIDKKRLATVAEHLPPPAETAAPRTPAERRVAALWAEVLALPADRVGRGDDFFALGGTSLSAIRFLARLGRVTTVRELAGHPVLADFAAFIDGGSQQMSPLALHPDKPPILGAPPGAGADWLRDHREELYATVTEHGAVLVRGLELNDLPDMRRIAAELLDEPVIEREGFAPRAGHGDGLYSSAEWPADQPMCMHHELSYALTVPRLLLFGCLTAPATGGATALADGGAVLSRLGGELVERFEERGWLLARHYGDEVGLRWQDAFGTGDRAEVEEYCRDNAIEYEWGEGDTLYTRQRRAAVLAHPLTGRRSWFNQIAFLNAWTMAPEVREYLVEVYGAERLPFNTFHGDGEPIGAGEVDLINKVYETCTLREPWRKGDLMIVDNLRMAHSREPYQGPREVLVAMGGPVRLAPAR
ncbi:non-ribosomal peptide synthetase [Sphaerisporangium perillae]|uniref:non-ribosomal peptide synthetase n=1 Tax=Sphaerisporangium perillae TaxID=2935860 RepID=UPI0020104535|nr:amino acid adenylation domain-containing protein [Sphaerisporangium perillae]